MENKMTQDNWRFCSKCFGLWFNGNPDNGICPAGGTHDVSQSGNYTLHISPDPGQPGWRWCHKCEGLWFSENNVPGVCPAGGAHSQTGSGQYVLQTAPAAGQDNWRWCHKCQGLWYNGRPTNGVCPAWQESRSESHVSTGSGDYALNLS